MSEDLLVISNGQVIGQVNLGPKKKLSFTYADEWRDNPNAFPLSLSMPLATAQHDHNVVEPFLWGLLPDNDAVLRKWAAIFQVSARNAFALLSHVGEDCAGAIQFIGTDWPEKEFQDNSIDWLNENDIGDRLRDLKADHSAGRRTDDKGQFTLAGAQPKTALIYQEGKWGIPSANTPTTHFLKPPTGDFDGFAENELFCMKLARRLDLPTASADIVHFGNEIAHVTERYDRTYQGGYLIRVHQEDTCQALAISPFVKYQNEGGPAVADIVSLLQDHSSEPDQDTDTFLKTFALNWLIAGTDAHAKNYSLPLGAAGRVRLAPLYDLSSTLPYDALPMQKLKLAMKLGGEYRLRAITRRHWHKLEIELDLEDGYLVDLARGVAASMPDHASDVQQRLEREKVRHAITDLLLERLIERSRKCEEALT
ncbi:type II toxin-antitoxin system HipA family toxin [Parvularcula sp. IMCC14364]|uniref:type II toxin-antitoxin system HipA family toxin n=1 Tax=Parvularcula sp. IMCC14364 TaxID=3067902 RepID=UPI0027414884|nr:type II toxin-antitoxin system HipA family toxin [Parvularcula sp. IMCC14364]